jgi:hypothetical protein
MTSEGDRWGWGIRAGLGGCSESGGFTNHEREGDGVMGGQRVSLRAGFARGVGRRPAGVFARGMDGRLAVVPVQRLGRSIAGLLAAGALAALALPAVALALPEGRAYEMVTPVYKGGYSVDNFAVNPFAVAADGESVEFGSPGWFAQAPVAGVYLARRGATGWSATPLDPPTTLSPNGGIVDLSPTLESALAEGEQATNFGIAPSSETRLFWRHSTDLPDTSANWEMAGEVQNPKLNDTNYKGASTDFCHIFVFGNAPLLSEADGLPIASTLPYEFDSGCDGAPASLQLVGLSDQHKLINRSCGYATIGDAEGYTPAPSAFNAIAAGGEEVFFTDCLAANSEAPNPAVPHQLFVSLDQTRTLEISKPLAESSSCAEVSSCAQAAERPSADFAGASEHGSLVYFTTAAPLVAGDTDTSSNLYLARIGCAPSEPGCEVTKREVASLVDVSHDPHAGQGAEVQGVVRVAPDGTRVYFVARGVLSEAANAQGALPVQGADNLYVYDSASGQTAFVGDLCSGFERSGAAPDTHCPSKTETDTGLWEGDRTDASSSRGSAAQTAGLNGAFLVFDTTAQLVPSDTDAARDVYRYGAQTGELNRVSLGEGGYDANGNDAFDATITPGHFGGSVEDQYEMNSRAISEDGSRIVFTTSSPLSPDAVNGLANVYEWHQEGGNGEGRVSLISQGTGEYPVEGVVISASGRDIFFETAQGLVPQDTDGLPDIYDARLGGGFPVSEAPRQPCSGDACQGPLTNPAPQLVPGSAAQAPGENLAPPAAGKATSKAKPKAKGKARAKCNRGKRHGERSRCANRRGRSARKAAAHHRHGKSSRGGNQ